MAQDPTTGGGGDYGGDWQLDGGTMAAAAFAEADAAYGEAASAFDAAATQRCDDAYARVGERGGQLLDAPSPPPPAGIAHTWQYK